MVRAATSPRYFNVLYLYAFRGSSGAFFQRPGNRIAAELWRCIHATGTNSRPPSFITRLVCDECLHFADDYREFASSALKPGPSIKWPRRAMKTSRNCPAVSFISFPSYDNAENTFPQANAFSEQTHLCCATTHCSLVIERETPL
jgi:hypothetical protein